MDGFGVPCFIGFARKSLRVWWMWSFLSFFMASAAKFLIKDKKIVGEFVQAGYRSSAAILGVAFIQNIYGDSGMAPNQKFFVFFVRNGGFFGHLCYNVVNRE